MDNQQLSMFKEWFNDTYPGCKDYLDLTYFDAEKNTFLPKCFYSPDSGNAAKVLRIAFGSWQHQQAKVEELQKRVDALTLALNQIAYPIPHMQKEAELNGCELNGYWAVKMSEDHTYSKDIARRALEKEQALKGEG
ncbi:hypothetical protein R5L37_01335 [Acinetobacter pittii]|uniref:hypothetical protein n=1 Tax=Acinetobacter pittii TaxID=48296 RepID=UPI0029535621|nr:hypothetical protein [Acinetobacter pittii]MDV8150409.1 hypothetical protein [Acinetobacter pittii]